MGRGGGGGSGRGAGARGPREIKGEPPGSADNKTPKDKRNEIWPNTSVEASVVSSANQMLIGMDSGAEY